MPESMDTLLREIRTERLRELMFEGDRLHDLRRRRLPIPASGGRPEIDAASLKLPIPQAETNVNLAL